MVDVHQRINARKFVLSYLYQYCFYSTFETSLDHVENEDKAELWESVKFSSAFLSDSHDSFFTEEFLADVQKLYDKSAEEWKQLKEWVQQILSEQWEEDMPYYLKNFCQMILSMLL